MSCTVAISSLKTGTRKETGNYYWIAYLCLVEEMTLVGKTGTTNATAGLMRGVGGFVCGTRRTGRHTCMSRSVSIHTESRRHVT